MGEDCTGKHQCEPATYDISIGDKWTCPDCDRVWTAGRIGDFHKEDSPMGRIIYRGGITPDHMMWHATVH